MHEPRKNWPNANSLAATRRWLDPAYRAAQAAGRSTGAYTDRRKFSDGDVALIRRLHAEGRTVAEIRAGHFAGALYQTVWNVCRRKTYAHLP